MRCAPSCCIYCDFEKFSTILHQVSRSTFSKWMIKWNQGLIFSKWHNVCTSMTNPLCFFKQSVKSHLCHHAAGLILMHSLNSFRNCCFRAEVQILMLQLDYHIGDIILSLKLFLLFVTRPACAHWIHLILMKWSVTSMWNHTELKNVFFCFAFPLKHDL